MATWAEEMTNLADAVNDDLSVSVTYRTVTPGAKDFTTGKKAATTADTTLNACRIGSRTYTTEQGRRVEETRWNIAFASLAAADVNDRIVNGSDIFRITRVERSCDGAMWELTTERSID